MMARSGESMRSEPTRGETCVGIASHGRGDSQLGRTPRRLDPAALSSRCCRFPHPTEAGGTGAQAGCSHGCVHVPPPTRHAPLYFFPLLLQSN